MPGGADDGLPSDDVDSPGTSEAGAAVTVPTSPEPKVLRARVNEDIDQREPEGEAGGAVSAAREPVRAGVRGGEGGAGATTTSTVWEESRSGAPTCGGERNPGGEPLADKLPAESSGVEDVSTGERAAAAAGGEEDEDEESGDAIRGGRERG